ncbi:hypothetical protein J6590_084678 [Homalodisca vitripennis]|nr:hypothetical protein J6590_084678 [Homalodisca vitripennis]
MAFCRTTKTFQQRDLFFHCKEAIANAGTKIREALPPTPSLKMKSSILVGASLRYLLTIQEFLPEILWFSKFKNLVDHATRQQPEQEVT